MPNAPAANTPRGVNNMVADAFASVISETPQLKTRLHEIANALLDKVLWDIDNGDPATVASHMRAFLPLLAREAAANDSDERMRALEAQIREMRGDFNGQFASARAEPIPTVEVSEDAPPGNAR